MREMVMIEEAVFIMMVCGLWGLGAYALYQRFIVNRRLRKRIDKYADALLAAAPTPAASGQALATQEASEFKRIQQRLEVLERIAVEKEDSLTREIEELRVASR